MDNGKGSNFLLLTLLIALRMIDSLIVKAIEDQNQHNALEMQVVDGKDNWL